MTEILREKFEQKFSATAMWRRVFKGSVWKKAASYPKKIIWSRIMEVFRTGAEPRALVENQLFWGPVFFTEGYFLDYYLCGYITEDNEVRLTRYLMKLLKPGMVFFDIGAHYGFFSMLAHDLFSPSLPSAGYSVHSFEPTPSTFAVLKKNLNGRNIKINQEALSQSTGSAELSIFAHPGFRGSNSLYGGPAEQLAKSKTAEAITVPTITLDDYCQRSLASPSVMKIDVESAEPDVLQGAQRILDQVHPEVIMEVWPAGSNTNHKLAVELLRLKGYNSYVIGDQGDLSPISWDKAGNSHRTDNIVFRYGIS